MSNRSKSILAGTLLIGLSFLFLLNVGNNRNSPTTPFKASVPVEAKPQKSASVPSSHSFKGNRKLKSSGKSWKEFSERFGTNLQPEFSPSGQLIAIHGSLASGSIGSSDFKPDDPKVAGARAQEIIAAAQDLLGVRPELPLENSSTMGSKISAQVYFREMFQGIPTEPVGNIKVDLGSNGELLALYSDYVGEINVENEFSLTSEQAREKAIAKIGELVPSDTHGKKIDISLRGGSKLIWVSGAKGSSAYRFFVQGHEVIIDAKTGEVLSNRDRRQF